MAHVGQLFSHVAMDIRQLVGKNVRRYRLAARLSQEELAARMQFEQGYVSGLEAGRRNPTIVTLGLVASALEIKPSLLLENLDAKPTKKSARAKPSTRP
jgi:transcriptional regulator with XRE-family HTH domain